MKHDFRAGWSSVIARVVAGWSPEEGDLKSLQGVKEAGKLSSSYIVTRDLNLQFEFAVEQSSQPPSDTAHAPLEGRCWVPVPTWIFFLVNSSLGFPRVPSQSLTSMASESGWHGHSSEPMEPHGGTHHHAHRFPFFPSRLRPNVWLWYIVLVLGIMPTWCSLPAWL